MACIWWWSAYDDDQVSFAAVFQRAGKETQLVRLLHDQEVRVELKLDRELELEWTQHDIRAKDEIRRKLNLEQARSKNIEPDAVAFHRNVIKIPHKAVDLGIVSENQLPPPTFPYGFPNMSGRKGNVWVKVEYIPEDQTPFNWCNQGELVFWDGNVCKTVYRTCSFRARHISHSPF